MLKYRNILRSKSWLVLTGLLLILSGQLPGQVLKLDPTFTAGVSDMGGQGHVSAIQADGKILVGGSFDVVNGVRQVCLTRLNADGTLDTTFNTGGTGPNLAVNEIVVSGDGKILIGGHFTSYNNAPISGIARLLPDGSLDPTFNPGGVGINSSGNVRSIVLQADGKIVFTGYFSTYNNVTQGLAVRVNIDGSPDPSFVTQHRFGAYGDQVALQADGKIVVVGSFMLTVEGQQYRGIVRFNDTGEVDLSFVAGSGPFEGWITTAGIQPDGRILIGGSFSAFNGVPRAQLVRLEVDGTVDPTFDPAPFDYSIVSNLKLRSDGKILAAGFFTTPGTLAVGVLFNTDGSLDLSFFSTSDNKARNVNISPNGDWILVGDFDLITGAPFRNGIARYHSDGSLDTSFFPSLTYNYGDIIDMAVQPDGKVLAGGLFCTANGVNRRNLTRFMPDGSLDGTFDPGVGPAYWLGEDDVYAVAVQPDGKILVGGEFDAFSAAKSMWLVRLNEDGSVDTSFNLSGFSYVYRIKDILVLADGKIVITGRFDFDNAVRVTARLNPDGSRDTTFGTGGIQAQSNDVVETVVEQPDGKLVFGGSFRLGAASPRGILRTNADGTADSTFTSNSFLTNDLFVQPDGKIVAGGRAGNRVIRLNANGTTDATFASGAVANGIVNSVALQPNGKILIGGTFSTVRGVSQYRLARLNVDGSLDAGFGAGFDETSGAVSSLAYQPDGKLLVGGTFNSYDGVPRKRMVRLTNRGGTFDFDGDGKTDISVFRPSNGNWYLQQSTDGFYAVNFGIATDKIVPADYDGDGKTDVAVYRPSTGIWYVVNSSDATFSSYGFGIEEDLPAPADYDGDGKADISVFRPSTGTWYRQNSSDGSFAIEQFGTNGDRPTIGDFDGDGKADVAVFRPSSGAWYQLNSSDGSFFAEQFGISIDKIVPADYDGDGKTDIAIYRPADGLWYVKNSGSGTYTPYIFGIAEDIPVPGDYDGDGKADIAVFRPSNGHWYISNSSSGSFTIFPWGQNGDRPTQSSFIN